MTEQQVNVEEVEIPEPIIKLVKKVFGKKNVKIIDWDMDRVYIGEDVQDDYTIRMWNITDNSIRWTLFKSIWNEDGSGYGEEQKSGNFKY